MKSQSLELTCLVFAGNFLSLQTFCQKALVIRLELQTMREIEEILNSPRSWSPLCRNMLSSVPDEHIFTIEKQNRITLPSRASKHFALGLNICYATMSVLALFFFNYRGRKLGNPITCYPLIGCLWSIGEEDIFADFELDLNLQFLKPDNTAHFENETKQPIWKWDKTAGFRVRQKRRFCKKEQTAIKTVFLMKASWSNYWYLAIIFPINNRNSTLCVVYRTPQNNNKFSFCRN